MSQMTVTLSKDELEGLIRRVVREELLYLVRSPGKALPDDNRHEGVDNPEEDALLLREALTVLQKYKDKPEAWMRWEEFEAELDRAEQAGELPA